MSTILNSTQLSFLEEVIGRFGLFVTYEKIAPYIPVRDEVGKRQFVSRLSQAGWLVRIKKGVYQIADLTSLGVVTLRIVSSRSGDSSLMRPCSRR